MYVYTYLLISLSNPKFNSNSSTTQSNHIFFGRPLDLVPSKFLSSAFFAVRFSSIPTTWPAHLSLVDLIAAVIVFFMFTDERKHQLHIPTCESQSQVVMLLLILGVDSRLGFIGIYLSHKRLFSFIVSTLSIGPPKRHFHIFS